MIIMSIPNLNMTGIAHFAFTNEHFPDSYFKVNLNLFLI